MFKKMIAMSLLISEQNILSMQSRINRLRKPIIRAALINKRQISNEAICITMAVSSFVVTSACDSYTMYKLMRKVNEKLDAIKTQNESLERMITEQQKEIQVLKMDKNRGRQK